MRAGVYLTGTYQYKGSIQDEVNPTNPPLTWLHILINGNA